jgi:D-methionine transport system substrate-binding protein
MQRRNVLKGAIVALGVVVSAGAFAQEKPIKVGVTGGPHAQIMEQVKKVAAKDGLTIQVVEFSDYIQPNAALAAGDLDANSYQHLPYLEAQIKDRGYKFTHVAFTVTFPMGVYSKKIKSLDQLKQGARRRAERSDQRWPWPAAAAARA